MTFKNNLDSIFSKKQFIFLAVIFLLFAVPFFTVSGFCVDISDDPMDTKVQAAPPNIMFILDNSGSMDWEFMTTESNGTFSISGSSHEYLFTDPGDNTYSSGDSNGTTLSASDRAYWKGQWSGYNKMYFNPNSLYTPWPDTGTYTMEDASLITPFSNPIRTSVGDPSITLKSTFNTVGGPAVQIIVDNEDAVFAGTWSESGFEPEWAKSEAIVTSKFTSANGTATFTPTFGVGQGGLYNVYVWWNCYTDRDTNALITINHAGGASTYRKSQKATVNNAEETGVCGQWILIDQKTFNDGVGGNVVIERDGASTNGSTIADAVKFESTALVAANVDIANAHYYTWYDKDADSTVDNGEIYLVTWEDSDSNGTLDNRLFFQLDSAGNDIVEATELKPLVHYEGNQANDEVPNDIQSKIYDDDGVTFTYKTDEQDLQNFANWYSYYRRRELTAKAAIAKSILDLDWVYAGFYTINSGVRQPVLPINVESNSIVIDNKNSGFTKSGTWNESSAQNYGQEYNSSSLYSYTGTAKWTPYLTAGTYNVYAWWGYAGSRTTTAQYTISHNSGTATVTKNHNVQTDAFQWQLLGTYTFDAGSSGYVTVQNTGSSSLCASADAIKFEKTTGGVTVDDTETLLDLLYSINSNSGTPLRTALRDVGRYYDQDDGLTGNLGTSPFKDEANGGACQQAFTILMTDGYYNGSDPNIGNEDGGENAPYKDTYSDTLADMAFKYYNTDLSTSLPDNLPTNAYDTKKSQHMVTYSVSFGVSGTIDPTDMDNDGNPDSPSYAEDPYFLNVNTPRPTWPNPDSGDSQKIDDLWHAAVNGRGEFFSADDPEELVSSLNSVFENLTSRIASGASVSVNGDELNTGSVLYQSTYTSGDWLGDVTAYPIDPITGEIKTEATDILWKASERLQSQDWDTGRRIVTFNGTDDILPFRYDSLTAAQKAALNATEATARDMVDYIRGKEISGFRARTKKLGDIVHSAPLLVIGDSQDNDFDGAIDEYADKDIANIDEENGIIFAGGNDGILHAFDASTGDEIFGYIPHLIFDNLDNLTAVNYSHKFYVDATPFAQTITINTNKKVLLTGGFKKGAKGYYCLDITNILYQNSSTFSEAELSTPAHVDGIDVLWEYPKLDTPLETEEDGVPGLDDIGYSFSDIFIVESYKTNNAPDNHNWVAIFGNGYDSINGSAVLYVLNAYTGELIRKIDTKTAGNNGLSSPALIDYNNDGKVDYAYAGDLLGNLWKFDLTSDDPTQWKVAYTHADSSPAPLFTAPNQPITSAPDVMNHCSETFGYMVLFGTGKFIGETDRTNIDQQTIYGIWDTGYAVGEWDAGAKTLSEMAGGTLLEQTVIDFQFLNGSYLRTLSDNTADWVTLNASGGVSTGLHLGWYFNLPMDLANDGTLDGERVIKDVMIRDKNLIAITFTPDSSPCTGGGYSMVMEMDACDGSRLTTPQFDINGDGLINNEDLIPIDDPDNPGQKIWVPPTGKLYDGLLHPPIIVTMPGKPVEMKIFSSSAGTTERMFEKASGGFYYWKEVK
ncbi:MAG: PilC/PilY family type IV pilus protein [Pseudomonadota bacterium]